MCVLNKIVENNRMDEFQEPSKKNSSRHTHGHMFHKTFNHAFTYRIGIQAHAAKSFVRSTFESMLGTI